MERKPKNTFKLSELPGIVQIDDDDLLLVSDKGASNSIQTKSMQIGQLTGAISTRFAKQISELADIDDEEKEQTIAEAIDEFVSKAIATALRKTRLVDDNGNFYMPVSSEDEQLYRKLTAYPEVETGELLVDISKETYTRDENGDFNETDSNS